MMDSLIIFGAKYLFAIVVLGAGIIGLLLPKKQRLEFLFAAVIAGVVAFGFTQIAAALYFDPRPFTYGVHALIAHVPDNGFPSDHSVVSMFAAALAVKYNKKVGMVLIVLALLVAYCRMAAGVHTFTDVFTGLFIGFIAAGVGYRVAKRRS